MPNTFPNHCRIKTSNMFRKLMATGDVTRGHFFVFFVKENQLRYHRLGVVVSKKTMKRAVDRNLVKRWLRSCFRGQVASPKCVDVVVLARKHAQALLREGKRYEKVCKEWQSVFANL